MNDKSCGRPEDDRMDQPTRAERPGDRAPFDTLPTFDSAGKDLPLADGSALSNGWDPAVTGDWQRLAQPGVPRCDQFLAMLSHELRNPMGAVLNATDALQTAAGAHGEVLEEIRVIQRQTQHMARLLDDLLDVSRITQNKIEFRREVVDLVPLADSVIECARHLIQRKNLQLTVDISETTLCVMGDPARLRQAQINLLTNAAKYTPDGGEIRYCLADASRRPGFERNQWSGLRDRESASSGQQQASIRVRDSGEGIPCSMLGRVFDWFVQSDLRLDRASGGMGVGLSLARQIVEAHGGSIVAHSEGPGRGSEFTIHLPLTDTPPAMPAGEPEHTFDGKRLLLVEDNEDARTMLVKTLLHKGFDVTAAADGLRGLEVCRSLRPDVAVIDLGLPKLDGYQLARAIRQVPALTSMLLIALTGYGRETDRQAAAEAGFDAHLIKPLNPKELYRLIARRLTPTD